MEPGASSQTEETSQRLWRLFLVGRTAVTGLMLLLLYALNGFAASSAMRSLYAVLWVQFAANGVYLLLWMRRATALLGYTCFVIDIALITLQVLVFGGDGYVLALAYLWPIVMAGRLVGQRTILPLTLICAVSFSLIVLLEQGGVSVRSGPIVPDAPRQALIISLPYLVFVALLLWALTAEMERSEHNLDDRYLELSEINKRLRGLVLTGERLLGSLDSGTLISTAVEQIPRLTGHRGAGVYLRQGGGERLQSPHSLPPNAPAELRSFASIGEDADAHGRGMKQLPLNSARGPVGTLAVYGAEGGLPDDHALPVLQILAHQLGSALDNARLYGDLQRESDMLRRIMLHMAEGVFVTDGQGHVVLSNHSAQTLLGIFEGQTLPDWLRTRLGEGQPHSALAEERIMVSVNDRVISLSAADMANGGGPAGAVYVARDVTHETQVERMKSEFLAYASHELRTPLTTIRMALHLLAMDVPRDPRIHEQIGVIETQVSRQTHMVDNLLDLARLEAGRYEMPLDDIDVSQVLTGVVRGMRPLAESKGLAIESALPPEPMVTLANAGGLEQVFTNLLSNAIKFTTRGKVTITGGRTDAEVFVQFRDTGIGMSADQRARIFSKFYTVRNPRKRGEGTGLGLAISSMIVRELGGRIDVQSEEGKGSTFTVYLPLRSSANTGGGLRRDEPNGWPHV